MRLMTEDVDYDLVAANERAQAWEDRRVLMKMGYLTPENMTDTDVLAIRAFFDRLPIIEPVDARAGLARIIGEARLVEGQDWCFATTRDGTFGVFSLDEPSRTFLENAMFHLWFTDAEMDPDPGGREDFNSLADYQTEALETALAA